MKVGNDRFDIESFIIDPNSKANKSSFRGDIALLKTKTGQEFVGLNFGIEIDCGIEIDRSSSKSFMLINGEEILAKYEISGQCSEFESIRDVTTMFCATQESSFCSIGQPFYAKDHKGGNQLIGLVSQESSDRKNLLITDIRKNSKWIKDIACAGGR